LFKTKLFITIVLLIISASCARQPAANNVQTLTANVTEQTRQVSSVNVVKATPAEVNLHAGDSGDAVVQLRIDSGYHVNANPPTFSYLKATELEVTPSPEISVAFITYPTAITKKFSFAEAPLAVYEGETTIKVRLKAGKSSRPGMQKLSGKLHVQACDDQVCYPPGTLDVTIPLNIK
jgi:thioredoxin:protein disulfide reductase